MGTKRIRKKIQCRSHGSAYATFVCAHLALKPAQEWFSKKVTKANPWPDAWCKGCDNEFSKLGEWTDDNSGCLDIKTLCHQCYEWARARGWD